MSKHQPAQRLAEFLPYQLSIASNAVSTRIAEQYRKRFALKTTEWRIMAVLGDHGALTQRELSMLSGSAESTIHRALKRLRDTDVISTGYRQLVIRQPGQLRRIAYPEGGPP